MYLHFYESKILLRNHEPGRDRFKFTYRFIDYLLSINNRNIIHDVRSIYPRFLEITNTNGDNFRNSTFLDIDIKIVNNKFITKVYAKRREFNFDILGLPAFLSNIPNNMTYGIISSQFSRFANICMIKEDFLLNCQLIINKINYNGFPSWLLKKYVCKFKNRKSLTISKFSLEIDLNHLLHF